MHAVIIVIAILAVGGCGSRDGRHARHAKRDHASGDIPSHVIIRVDTVAVRPTRPTGETWDGPIQVAAKDNSGCEVFAAVAGLGVGLAYGPAAGSVANKGASFLCRDTSVPAQVQQDPRAPDLQILLSAADEKPFASPRADNVTQHLFLYPFLVPVAAIPADGVKLRVLDVDDNAHELIGVVRISRDHVVAALQSATHLIVLQNVDSIARIEVFVDTYVPAAGGTVDMYAREGTKNSGAPNIVAGEVVEVSATGSYNISDALFFGYTATLSPTGYPGGGPREYNYSVPPLSDAAHGCGFVAIGHFRRAAALVAPAARFLSPTSGPMIVGVNDTDPGNNTGALRFKYHRRAPAVAEWLRGEASP